MGFKQRKLLSKDEIHEEDQGYDPCVFCYDGCPDECKNKNIWSNPPCPPSSNNHKPTILILMLCVLAVAFMFLVYLTIRRYRWNLRNSRRRSAQTVENTNNGEGLIDENQGPVVDHPIWYIRTVGLQQSVIDSIAVFKYKKGSGLIEGIDCSVCLNEFQEDEILRLLPICSHAFHLPCIDTWLRSHQNCPVCRAPIVVATGPPTTNLVLTNSTDLGSREDARVGSELGRRVVETDEARETSRGDENDQPLQIEDGKLAVRPNVMNKKLRVLSDSVDNRVKLVEELQPVRRSMSMDLSFSSSSMVCNPIADIEEKNDEGCSDKRNLDMNAKRSRNLSICRLIKSASFGRSLQKGPIPMKRSSSIVGKHSRKYSASQHNLNFS